jgi:hypothetical protein
MELKGYFSETGVEVVPIGMRASAGLEDEVSYRSLLEATILEREQKAGFSLSLRSQDVLTLAPHRDLTLTLSDSEWNELLRKKRCEPETQGKRHASSEYMERQPLGLLIDMQLVAS